MENWIKQIIREEQFGFLSYFSSEGIHTIPLYYTYKHGHLISSLSILHVEKLNELKSINKASLVLKHDHKTVTIQGDIKVDESDLDSEWKHGKSTLLEIYPQFEQYDRGNKYIPHLWKRAIIDLKPSIITAISEGSVFKYELEIL